MSKEEENVKEIIYFQGLHGRIKKIGNEKIDFDLKLSKKWQTPIYNNNILRILNKIGIDENYLDDLNNGDIIAFEDATALNGRTDNEQGKRGQ